MKHDDEKSGVDDGCGDYDNQDGDDNGLKKTDQTCKPHLPQFQEWQMAILEINYQFLQLENETSLDHHLLDSFQFQLDIQAHPLTRGLVC